MFPMTTEEYRIDTKTQAAGSEAHPDAASAKPGTSYNVIERAAPIVEAFFSVIEDDKLPDRVFETFSTALFIVIEAAEDDALGLISATPEYVWQQRPDRFPEAVVSLRSFDPALCTSYVLTIYAREIESVRLASPEHRSSALRQAAYNLARVVAAHALPSDHVRDSLVLAAQDMPPAEVRAVIDEEFRKGFQKPRALPQAGAPE
jgi:hypothetical protein